MVGFFHFILRCRVFKEHSVSRSLYVIFDAFFLKKFPIARSGARIFCQLKKSVPKGTDSCMDQYVITWLRTF